MQFSRRHNETFISGDAGTISVSFAPFCRQAAQPHVACSSRAITGRRLCCCCQGYKAAAAAEPNKQRAPLACARAGEYTIVHIFICWFAPRKPLRVCCKPLRRSMRIKLAGNVHFVLITFLLLFGFGFLFCFIWHRPLSRPAPHTPPLPAPSRSALDRGQQQQLLQRQQLLQQQQQPARQGPPFSSKWP